MGAHESVDVVFLDVARTFDSVINQYLYVKLGAYGVYAHFIERVLCGNGASTPGLRSLTAYP